MKNFTKMNKLKIIIFIFLLLLITDIFVLEPNMLILKHEDVYLKKWDKELNGYKIGIISDLHIGTHFVSLNKVSKIVEKINSQNPDVIVLLGDLDAKSIGASKYSNEDISGVLGKLNAKDGVFSVLGNHDYEPNKEIVSNILYSSKITLLENEEKQINHNGATLRIVGFKDLWHHYLHPKELVKFQNSATIVLSHNPDVFADMPKYVDLTLSGHTHGGEIYIPVLGAPFVPSKFGQKFRKGLVKNDNQILYVSGGVATLSRGRFFNPPEITIITINKQK